MRHVRQWSKAFQSIAFISSILGIASAIVATVLTVEAFRLPFMVPLQPHQEWQTDLLYSRRGAMVTVLQEDGDNSACTATPNSCIWVVSEHWKDSSMSAALGWIITLLLFRWEVETHHLEILK
jgi:hypothetical protein